MLVVIKGAGDLASGIALRLVHCGISVIMTDLEKPTAIRRTVSFSEAIRAGRCKVEDVSAQRAESIEEIPGIVQRNEIAVLIDPQGSCIAEICPDAVVDAIIAKKNIGTRITDAPIVIGVGPGFTAGVDCHAVIETKRGHDLGRVILSGSAVPNTGIPGNISGFTTERVLRAPASGVFHEVLHIGDIADVGQTVAYVDGFPVSAQIHGIVRGLLPSGTVVSEGMKSGDIDPRCVVSSCFTVSDKARAIGGGVLEALLMLQRGYPYE